VNFEHLVILGYRKLINFISFSQAQYISKLVKIAGITIAASRTKAKATYVTLICKNCKKGKQVPCRPGLGGAVVPRSCDHVPQV
jgi:DNA replication licensing factor MCM5